MRVAVRDVAINYEIEGQGPAIVLTHGLGGTLKNWEATARELRDRYAVVRWDVRGFGDSDKPKGPVTPRDWAADLSGLLEVLNLPEAIIVGISMGGVVAQRFAIDFPRQTRALVLLSTSSEVSPQAQQRWERMAARIEEGGMVAGGGLGAGLAFSETFAQNHVAEINERNLELLRNDPHAYAAASRAVGSYNFTAELASIGCPTLILQGLQDRLTPPGGSVIMSRQIPNPQLEMIDNCGHAIPTERHTEMMSRLNKFLQGL